MCSLQVVGSSILQLYKRSSFIFLVPLLIFNGFEQGFIYSDYTKVCFVNFCFFFGKPVVFLSTRLHSRIFIICKKYIFHAFKIAWAFGSSLNFIYLCIELITLIWLIHIFGDFFYLCLVQDLLDSYVFNAILSQPVAKSTRKIHGLSFLTLNEYGAAKPKYTSTVTMCPNPQNSGFMKIKVTIKCGQNRVTFSTSNDYCTR